MWGAERRLITGFILPCYRVVGIGIGIKIRPPGYDAGMRF